jgi:hypothetical protein
MSNSVMPTALPHVGAGAAEPDGDEMSVRDAVLAGPGLAARLDEQARSWLLDRLVGCDAVAAALESCGHVDIRRRGPARRRDGEGRARAGPVHTNRLMWMARRP